MNCGLCGRRMSRFEIAKWKKDGRPICRNCRKDILRKDVEKATPSQIEALKIRTHDAALIEELVKETKLKEQATLHKPVAPKKDEHGCVIGVEKWNKDLHQCVKIEKHPPTREQIPAQPVVPVGPVTIEQKVATLNDEIAKIQKQIAFIFGVLGQRPAE